MSTKKNDRGMADEGAWQIAACVWSEYALTGGVVQTDLVTSILDCADGDHDLGYWPERLTDDPPTESDEDYWYGVIGLAINEASPSRRNILEGLLVFNKPQIAAALVADSIT
jgi:hypothetical protein